MLCVVVLCDCQGIDVKSMGRIFIGLIKCGAWGCFDEFNRLEEAVLSAVSMQIQVIQDAIKQRSPSVELLARKVGTFLVQKFCLAVITVICVVTGLLLLLLPLNFIKHSLYIDE